MHLERRYFRVSFHDISLLCDKMMMLGQPVVSSLFCSCIVYCIGSK
jgi:hypothetical protein